MIVFAPALPTRSYQSHTRHLLRQPGCDWYRNGVFWVVAILVAPWDTMRLVALRGYGEIPVVAQLSPRRVHLLRLASDWTLFFTLTLGDFG
jgi:hypothetical protein